MNISGKMHDKENPVIEGQQYRLQLGEDKLLTPSKDYSLLGTKINSNDKIAHVAKPIQIEPEKVIILFVDAELKVRAIQDVPLGIFHTEKSATDYLRGRYREFGSYEVIKNIIKPERIKALAESFPGTIIVPEHVEKAKGKNKLLSVYAEFIGDITGLEVDTEIMQNNKAQRTTKGALSRLSTKVLFDGPVKKGYNYIIVDDVFTMGGTLAGLKEHIENNGGHVVAATTLATARGKDIAPTKYDIQEMERRFGCESIEEFLREAGIADNIESLTAPEARHILSFKNVDSLGDRIAKERQEGIRQGDERIPGKEPDLKENITEYSIDASSQTGGFFNALNVEESATQYKSKLDIDTLTAEIMKYAVDGVTEAEIKKALSEEPVKDSKIKQNTQASREGTGAIDKKLLLIKQLQTKRLLDKLL